MKELKKSGASKKQAEAKQKTQQKQKNKNKKDVDDDGPQVGTHFIVLIFVTYTSITMVTTVTRSPSTKITY